MTLFELVGKIFVDNSEANKGIDDTTDKAEKAQSKIGGSLQKVGKVGGNILAGVAGMGATAIGSMVALSDSTRDYRTEMGKLDTAFATNNHSSEAAKQTYKDLYAVLGESDQSVETANHLAKLTTTEQELQQWTDICTGVFATFGNSLPVEGLAEAANETAKVGQVTGPLADALNWAGESEDEFNAKLAECSSEQERQQLITSTLTDLYSEASDQYKETNKDVMEANSAQGSLSDTMAKFGAIAEPIVSKLLVLFVSLLEGILPLVEVIANQFIPQLMPVIEDIFPLLIDLINTLLPPIMQIVSALLPVIVQLISILVPPLIQIVQLILPLLITLLEPLLPLLEPILNLLTPILNLVLALIEPLVRMLNEILPPIIENLSIMIETILPYLQAAIEVLGGIVQNCFIAVFEQFNPVLDEVKKALNGLITFITSVFKGDWESAWEGIKEFFEGIWNAIWATIKGVINLIIEGINALWTGIYDAVKGIVDSIGDVAGALGDLIGQDWEFSMPDEPPLIPKLARGGIVDEATHFIAGEDGKEAVIPLEKNTGWIDKVAQQINNNRNNNDNPSPPPKVTVIIHNFVNNTEQDIDELVEIIDRKLAEKIKRREAVYGYVTN